MLGPVDDRFINRELSWLAFDDRVSSSPASRASHCSSGPSSAPSRRRTWTSSSRSASRRSKDQVAAGVEEPTADGRTAAQQLAAIKDRAHELVARQEAAFLDELVPALAAAGIAIVRWDDLDAVDRKRMTEVYEQRIFPVLTPLAVDPSHPFPYISDLVLASGRWSPTPIPSTTTAASPGSRCRPCSPRLFEVDEQRYIPAEELIIAQLHTLVLGDGRRGGGDVPRHPQRRPHARGGGGRRPARSARDGAAPAPLQQGGAPGGLRPDERRDARPAHRASSRSAPTTSTAAGRRSTSASCGSCTASTAPTSRTGRGRR